MRPVIGQAAWMGSPCKGYSLQVHHLNSAASGIICDRPLSHLQGAPLEASCRR